MSLPQGRAVGAVDAAPDRRAEWASTGASPVYATLGELLDRARPDVVVVATPPHAHAELCIEALSAGAHVMCEKPFVASVAEADRVLEVARRNRRQVVVNHEFRYMPIFARIGDVVGGPDVGEPVFLHCTQFMDLAPWEEKVAWRAAMPHRSLFEGGVHLVDLLHMVAGRLPRRVFAMTSAGLDNTRSADAIHLVTLDYGDGLLGQLTIDRLCRSGTRYVDLRLDCERSSIRASYGGRAFLQVGVKRAQRPGVRVEFGPEGLAWVERGLRRSVFARNPRGAATKATRALYQATVNALQAGTEAPSTAAIARETLRIIEAAYRSVESGQPVDVEP
ncbi:MAG: Gfo/Idh/MocA family oxidoreductase [Actinomycetota bacterium]|nr:Gfo/Idh/MocA family oxidoreductase [Actinomycetota bacterium]